MINLCHHCHSEAEVPTILSGRSRRISMGMRSFASLRMTKLILFFMMILCSHAHATSVCKKDICVQVEVVSKDDDLRRGLQGRDMLANHQGMLFVFNRDGFYRFWMKDMKFPVDMIWIDRQYRIVTIAPSQSPCRQDPCPVYEPLTPARYCLEVADGFVVKNQFKIGDRLEFSGI